MFKEFRVQIDEDPVFINQWRNFIDTIHEELTYGLLNGILRDYNAYLIETVEDNTPGEEFKYPVLIFMDNIGYMSFVLRYS